MATSLATFAAIGPRPRRRAAITRPTPALRRDAPAAGHPERRSEIGLRRALGTAVTAVYSTSRGARIVIPIEAVVGGIVAALLIGASAGLYPSMRAARLSPTGALRTV